MKEKKEKKLHLGKVTFQDLDSVHHLDRFEQKAIQGGGSGSERSTTVVPVFCKP